MGHKNLCRMSVKKNGRVANFKGNFFTETRKTKQNQENWLE